MICTLCAISDAAHSAKIANVKYIHDYITANKGVTIVAKETNTSKVYIDGVLVFTATPRRSGAVGYPLFVGTMNNTGDQQYGF